MALPLPTDLEDQLKIFDRFKNADRSKKGHIGILYQVAYFKSIGYELKLSDGIFDVFDGMLTGRGIELSLQAKAEVLFWSKYKEHKPSGGFSLSPGPQYEHAKLAQVLMITEVPTKDDAIKLWHCTDLNFFQKHVRSTNKSLCYVFPRYRMTLKHEANEPEWAQQLRRFS